ncbi:MAG: DUF2071 domain-containing protein [Chthonomonadaceae bacterium]|nr:DUF2071 domain-containing protein [Chthonomonadaceae bacterium]
MHQRWTDLLFLHASLEPEVVRPLLPAGLDLDTYPDAEGREKAWVGLVPFRMSGIRPRGLPALPWLSAFPETNVRTYVHRNGRDPGVWFFSLEAARWLACRFARATFGLNYRHARMQVSREGDRITYRGRRLEAPKPAELAIEAVLGPRLPQPEPGSFEFFLVERYLLYSMHRGSMVTGRVAHEPYALRSASVASCSEQLLARAGIAAGPWEHVCFSEGVDVRVYPVARVEE